jgi:hypothetical protein
LPYLFRLAGHVLVGGVLNCSDPRVLWWVGDAVGALALSMFLWLHQRIQSKLILVMDNVPYA